MVETVRATFDGEVLRPEQPVGLKAHATYLITIEREVAGPDEQVEEVYPLTAIARLATDMGVDDLSTRHDWYAHGRPSSDTHG